MTFKPYNPMKAESLNIDENQNTAAPPVGAPEGQLPDTVNDGMRWDKADSREKFDWIQALDTEVVRLENDKVNTTRQVIAGNGISGGGALTSDVTLNLALSELSTVGSMADADTFAINGGGFSVAIRKDVILIAANIDNTPAGNIAATDVQAALNELDTEKVPTTRDIIAGVGISGGGDLSADRQIDWSPATLTAATDLLDSEFITGHLSGGGQRRITKGNFLKTLPFVKVAAPADQALANSSSLTFAHGLTLIPDLVEVSLVCKTAQAGYVSGEIVSFPPSEGTNGGMSFKKDATNVVVNTGPSSAVVQDGGGGRVTLTPANWDVRVRAWI